MCVLQTRKSFFFIYLLNIRIMVINHKLKFYNFVTRHVRIDVYDIHIYQTYNDTSMIHIIQQQKKTYL